MNENEECRASFSLPAVVIKPKRSWVIIIVQSVLPQDSIFYISGDFISLSSCFYKFVVDILYIFGGFRFDTYNKRIGVLRTCVSFLISLAIQCFTLKISSRIFTIFVVFVRL